MPPLAAVEYARDRRSEAEIAAIIRGKLLQPADADAFVRTALDHRMAPLLVRAGVGLRLPPVAAARLVDEARQAAVISELRDRELCRVLCALRAEQVDVLLMKGAHLAHSHYPEPHLRQRDDADLLIAAEDRGRVAAILEREGYRHLPDVTGEIVLGQMMFEHEGAIGAVLDVHSRIAAPRIAADLLQFTELNARAVPLPRLGPCARGPVPIDALALASIHQAAHHPQHDLMAWLYDTYLIVSAFSDAEIEDFVAMANERGMARVCGYTVGVSMEFFPTPKGQLLLERLKGAHQHERTAFLVNPRAPLAELASDLSATRGWRPRLRLLLAHLFPPADYMRHAYGVSNPLALAACYAFRIARGAARWVRAKT